MAVEIAAAYIPIIPTFRGVKKELEKGILPIASSTGLSAGKSLGDNLS